VVVFALDSTIVVAWLAVVETYVKLNVVPEITVVVTPNGTWTKCCCRKENLKQQLLACFSGLTLE
jgi:hypothetical protein